MDASFNITDSSDWLQTPVSQLGPVEAALRCQVCKDFFHTPMITSCAHTFCSLCIRRCITTDGRCPICRSQDQEIKLRANPLVQELVDLFQVARPGILQLCEDFKILRNLKAEGSSKRKRKLEIMENADDDDNSQVKTKGRMTRSRHRSQRNQSLSPSLNIDQVVDDIENKDCSAGKECPSLSPKQPLKIITDDGLIACPICNLRMKEEAVFSHLDVHNASDSEARARIIPTR